MSGKSKRSSPRIDRPFAASILVDARRLAEQYQVILQCEDGRWYGRGLELSRVYGDGATPEECIEQTREALAVTVAALLEQGQSPPKPAREGKRAQQVNVRLTAEERVLLETAARQRGYTGLSDFIRSTALEAAR